MLDNGIHIGIFVSSLNDMGGAIRVAVALANRMCSDYRVTIVELGCSDESVFPLDMRVGRAALNIPNARLRKKLAIVSDPLEECLSKQGINVLLGIGLDETIVAVRPCRKNRTPLVFCDHGALINQIGDKPTTALRFICAHVCAKTIVLTRQSKEDYHRIFRIGDNKIVAIPNWVPAELMKRETTYDSEAKSIVWAGRLDKEKGVDLLFRIAKEVLSQRKDWTWDVYGKAVLHTGDFDLSQAIEEAGLKSRFRMQGCVDDLYDRYPRYAIASLTSYREGFSLFLAEGGAAGLPLVSFDVNNGPRDIIKDGVNGFLIKPFDVAQYVDKLLVLMDNADLRKAMSTKSRELTSRFSEDAIYDMWRGLVESLR